MFKLSLFLVSAFVVGMSPSSRPPAEGTKSHHDQHTKAEEPFRIGILYWSMEIPGQVAMRTGLEAELAVIVKRQKDAGERGIEAIVRVAGDGTEGIERQIKQMRELVELKPDLIIVQPTDNAALAAPLLAANAAGIPVVAYDQYISAGKLESFLTSDNYQAGYLCGEYTAAQFEDAHAIQLVLVEYPHVSSTVARVNGFIDALTAYEQPFKIRATYQAVEPKSGALAGQAILKDFPRQGSIDAVFTVNDGGGLAVVDALAEAGRSEILVATIDGDSRSVENIKSGRLTQIDCAQFCGALGRETMRVSWKILKGEEVPLEVLVPVFPITAKTAQHFRGWNKPPPKSFKKPWPSNTPNWVWALKVKPERLGAKEAAPEDDQ